MPLRKNLKDIMIPIDHYAVVDPGATLQEAVSSLRTSYCKIEKGFCEETGPRTVLVVDSKGELVGVLDFRSILKVLVPEVAGSLSERIAALEISIVFAQAGAEDLDLSQEDVTTRVIKNAQVKVKKIMLKNIAHVQSDTSLLDALKLSFRKKLVMLPVYEGKQLVGVVRDADLFLAVADIII